MASNDTRTRTELESRGYTYWKTEYWNHYARKRKDLIGCLDAIGLKPGSPILGVQTTSRGNVSSRLVKIKDQPLARLWLETGNSIEIHGWDQPNGKGTKWRVRIRPVTLDDFDTRE